MLDRLVDGRRLAADIDAFREARTKASAAWSSLTTHRVLKAYMAVGKQSSVEVPELARTILERFAIKVFPT